MPSPCDTFLNRPKNSYRPLSCKPIVVTTREVTGTGQANKNNLFFLTKANTIREHATLDLLFTTPDWLNKAILTKTQFVRITANGHVRVTQDGHTRVIEG